MKRIEIDNSKKSAVTTKNWKPDKKQLFETAMSASTPMSLVSEVFLQVDKPNGKNTVLGTEHVHYPHHDIIEMPEQQNRTKYICALNVEGVEAAYALAKQKGIYEGALKEHIDQHRKELGLMSRDLKLQEAADNIDKAFDLLTEALGDSQSDTTPAVNMFEDFMTEAPVAQPAPTSAPQAAPTADEGQPMPQDAPATIPVQDPNPAEDTSMNNPVQGPDSRDQENLDGNARKEEYQAFADALKAVDNNNVFGTIFDEDIFKSEYRIVPYEMRYFYRLQNPVSVASGDFQFIPFGAELIEAQEKYDLGKKMFVFATYSEKPVFFNMLDKTIWFNDKKVGETFDGLIDKITQDQGNIDFTEDNVDDANVVDVNEQPDAAAAPDPNNPLANDAIDLSQPADPNAPDLNAPMDLSQPATASTQQPTPTAAPSQDFGPETLGQPGGNIAPMDLTQQNASVDPNGSVLDEMFEFNNPFKKKETPKPQPKPGTHLEEFKHEIKPRRPEDDHLANYNAPNIDDILAKHKNSTKKNESVDLMTETHDIFDGILDEMFEGTAFPNDALDERNRQDAARRQQRRFGTLMTD